MVLRAVIGIYPYVSRRSSPSTEIIHHLPTLCKQGFLENLEKDYYNKESYAVYNGGNRQLQIVKNNLNPNGKKVLIVRDSFACVVTPFLSLQTSELHICDVRKHQDGEKIDVEDYINRLNPDYVIVLYSGVGKSSNPLYNFF